MNNQSNPVLANRIVELSNERDALRAQVEQLRETIHLAYRHLTCLDKIGDIDGVGSAATYALLVELESAIKSTPTQCLAEVRAQAVEEFFSQVKYMEGLNVNDICDAAEDYANQLRQQSQEQSE